MVRETAAVCIAVTLGTSQPARAQGTMGTFVDPIGLTELSRQFESNGIDSASMWQQVEAAHARYLEQCELLRNGVIEKVLDNQRALFANEPATHPTAAQVGRLYEEMSDAMKRFIQVDASLFSELRMMLPEASHPGLARIQLARERDFYPADQFRGHVGPSALVDVAALYSGMSCLAKEDAQAHDQCWAAVADYSRRQVRGMESLFTAVNKGLVEQAEFIEANPTPDGLEVDEAELRAKIELLQASMAKVFAPVEGIGRALRENNRRAYRAIREILVQRDSKCARKWRELWIAQAYPTIKNGAQYLVDSVAMRALRLKSLDEGQRAVIRQTVAQWQLQDDRVVDQHTVLEDRWSDTESQNIGKFMQLAYADHADEVRRLEEQREAIATGAKALITGVVGPEAQEMFAKLSTHEEAQFFLPESQISLEEATARPLDPAEEVEFASGNNAQEAAGKCLWRTKKMGEEWTTRIATSLGSTGQQLVTLQTLMADYQAQWNQIIRPEADALRELSGLPTELPIAADAPGQVSDESAAMQWKLRAQTLDGARTELETHLFDDIKTVVADPSQSEIVNLLRCARRCGERIEGIDFVFDSKFGGEESANIALAVTGVKLSAQDCALVANALAGRLEQLEQCSRALDRAERELWLQRAVDELTSAMLGQLNDSSRWALAHREMRAREAKVIEAGEAAVKAKARAQREAFTLALGVLDDSARKVVQSAFLKDAYFQAYGAHEPAKAALDSACRLSDLTESQRGQLSIARDEYESQRDGAVSMMVSVMKADAPSGRTEGSDQASSTAATIAQMEALERYAFARDEARDKLLLRLKLILTADQLRAAGIK